jgi:hypothetical protein
MRHINIILTFLISLLLLCSCTKLAEDGKSAPGYISNMAHDLSDGKVSEIEILGRGKYSTTTSRLMPDQFWNITHDRCAKIRDKPRFAQLSKVILTSKYRDIDEAFDTYWHILFFDNSGSLVHDLYMGMKYSNYKYVYWRIDGHLVEDDGSLEGWLDRNVIFRPCEK